MIIIMMMIYYVNLVALMILQEEQLNIIELIKNYIILILTLNY